MSPCACCRSTTPSSRDFAAAAWIIGCISVPSLSSPNHSSHISRSIALSRPVRLEQLLVVGRVPGLEDHRRLVEALDQDPALVVHREVHRAEHPLAAALAQPAAWRRRSARATTSGSSLGSKKPNMPSLPPWNSSQRWSMWAVIRPTTSPSRSAEEELGLGVLEPRVLARGRGTGGARSAAAAPTAGRPPRSRYGSSMKAFRSRLPATGRIVGSVTRRNLHLCR